MDRNLKIFLAAGIPFGIIMAVLFSFLYGINAGLKGGLVAGLAFGFLMFIILGLLQSRTVKKIAGNVSEKSMATHQTRDIKLQLPYDKTFDLCIKSIGEINKCKIQERERSKGIITAKTSVNWKTWGDTISFEITKIDNENTAVKISSRPTTKTTIVDYGKNLENVKAIVSFIDETIV